MQNFVRYLEWFYETCRVKCEWLVIWKLQDEYELFYMIMLKFYHKQWISYLSENIQIAIVQDTMCI